MNGQLNFNITTKYLPEVTTSTVSVGKVLIFLQVIWEPGRPINVAGRPIDPNSAFQLQGQVTDVQVEHITTCNY